MKKIISVFIFVLLFSFCSNNQETEQREKKFNGKKSAKIVITAWVIGPEKTSITRLSNLQEAVDQLNNKMPIGQKKIELQGEFWTGKPADFRRKFQNAFKLGMGPDIVCFAHEEIPILVKKGYIEGLDEYIKTDKTKILKEVFPNLWKACSYKNKIYAIPQDTEVRGIFYRKDILAKMGWSKKKIEDFPLKIEQGMITQYDILRIALKAKKRKLVKWAIFHRPTIGVNFFHHLMAFGATKLQDEKTGKMIFSRKAMLKTLSYFYNIVHKHRLMPKEMTALSWQVMDSAIPKGRILFNITGGSWNKAEYIHDQGMSEKDFYEKVGFCLIPAAKKGGSPVTLSHPLVYVMNSKTRHKDLVFNILTLVSKPSLNLKHALASSHLVISKEAASSREFTEDPFLKRATSFLKYTNSVPNHEKYYYYEKAFFDAIKRVEMLKVKPTQALKQMEKYLKEWVGDEIIIQ